MHLLFLFLPTEVVGVEHELFVIFTLGGVLVTTSSAGASGGEGGCCSTNTAAASSSQKPAISGKELTIIHMYD